MGLEARDAHQLTLEQAVSEIKDLDCDQVSETQWEDLGEAWMGQIHFDPGVHERMDQMMGGEGSESLRQAHMRMGQNYLGCGSKNLGMAGMMRTGMKGWGGGWQPWYQPAGILSSITWLAVIAALIAITRYFWKKGGEKK